MNLNFTNSVLYPTIRQFKSKVKHQVGNVYHIDDDGSFYAVLAQVEENTVALICLENSANRYSAPFRVKSIRSISPKEFIELSGSLNCAQVEIVYIGRVEDVLKVTVPPLTSAELFLNKIFGEDKDVISGS